MQLFALRRSKAETIRVMVVDQWTGYDRNLDNYDGLHPNASGEQKMADKWFAALEDLFQGDTLFGRGAIHDMSGKTGQDILNDTEELIDIVQRVAGLSLANANQFVYA